MTACAAMTMSYGCIESAYSSTPIMQPKSQFWKRNGKRNRGMDNQQLTLFEHDPARCRGCGSSDVYTDGLCWWCWLDAITPECEASTAHWTELVAANTRRMEESREQRI